MLVVKLTDAQGTSFFGNVLKASFAEGVGKFSQLVAGGIAVVDAAGFTMSIYTDAGFQLGQQTFTKENQVEHKNVDGDTAAVDRPRVQPRAKRRGR